MPRPVVVWVGHDGIRAPWLPRTVLGGSAGFFTKRRWPVEVADLLQSVIDEQEMHRAFGANARRQAEELFPVGLVADDLEICDSLLHRAAQTSPPQYADGMT